MEINNPLWYVLCLPNNDFPLSYDTLSPTPRNTHFDHWFLKAGKLTNLPSKAKEGFLEVSSG